MPQKKTSTVTRIRAWSKEVTNENDDSDEDMTELAAKWSDNDDNDDVSEEESEDE